MLCHFTKSSNCYITHRSGHHHTNTTLTQIPPPNKNNAHEHDTPPPRPHRRGAHGLEMYNCENEQLDSVVFSSFTDLDSIIF
jgi:hypothetical protein